MRCMSWNVNGIRAVHRKQSLPWQVMADCEAYCLQEVKGRPDQVPADVAEPDGLHAHWFPARRPGYSGVAIFTRDEPDEVIEGLGDADFDDEGRTLSVRFGDLILVDAYFPNSQENGARLGFKLAYCAAMEAFLARQRKAGRRVCLLGDYNIAHRPIDLARPEANENNPGYLPQEREWFSRYLDLGYHDVFREEHPDLAGAYTWWTYRGGARNRNVGWRIDYATVDPELRDAVAGVAIHPEILGSDHCPVSIDLKV